MTSQPEPLLTVRNLSVTFPGTTSADPVPVVRGVDLDVCRGEVVALLGESGSGKSVTARAVMGLAGAVTGPDAGSARVDTGVVSGLPGAGAHVTADTLTLGDVDLRGLDQRGWRAVRGERMSLVLQDALSALNPVLPVGTQIAELLRVHRGESRRAARAAATDLLGLVGIPDPPRRVRDHPHQFSGGMRQRVLIAMAVALQPELLIADEPTTALDVTVQAQILALLDRLRTELGMAVLLITHDLGVVTEVADRMAVMYAGRIVERGGADAVLDRPGHPYTAALLRSVPRPDARGGDLAVIPGSPPQAGRAPAGCAFHPRCVDVVTVCRDREPELATVGGPSRSSACHRREEYR